MWFIKYWKENSCPKRRAEIFLHSSQQNTAHTGILKVGLCLYECNLEIRRFKETQKQLVLGHGLNLCTVTSYYLNDLVKLSGSVWHNETYPTCVLVIGDTIYKKHPNAWLWYLTKVLNIVVIIIIAIV